MNRMILFQSCRRLAWALIFGVAASAAPLADTNLSGDYEVAGQTSNGRAYTGQMKIVARGEGYAIAWRLDEGGAYRGLAIKMDNVLGAVYWPVKDPLHGHGIVAYHIEGGELQGIWLVAGGTQKTGRETLKGSPDLAGEYQITLGENPDDMTNYGGRVRMERRGDHYRVSWYTPGLSYIGNGIRIGDVLVVGYALGEAPGTVGYCVGNDGLRGVWTYGSQVELGRESLKRGAQDTQPAPESSEPVGCQLPQSGGQ
ncbi:MAG TPA: hypothetical protein VLB05_06375 [Dongiaceae bacterium]|nr:hypothetical protein [Dongiaceae bacterium]